MHDLHWKMERWGKLGDGEQMGLETRPQDNHGGCGGDLFRQTVPDTINSNWKCSVANHCIFVLLNRLTTPAYSNRSS